MLPSIVTAFLFAASGISGRRAAVNFGPLRANALRLSLAMLLLGLLAGGWGACDFGSSAVQRLVISGVVGFGIGDVALFLAYPRLGARLTLLLNMCSAPFFGAAGDWWLVGTGLTWAQVLSGVVILSGVGLALGTHDRHGALHSRSSLIAGVVFAILAGFGQGMGAALSRFAHAAMVADGVPLLPVQQAFVRTIPGSLFALLAWGAVAWWRSSRASVPGAQVFQPPGPASPHRWWWLLAAAFFGPALGVTCFQWALSSAPTAVVLSITSTTPLLIIPLSVLVDGDRPGRLAAMGAVIGVAGVIIMVWCSQG